MTDPDPFDAPAMPGGAAGIARDRYGRPLVTPPGGGKPMAYTRATTIAGILDDRYNLELWKLRQVASGLSRRRDLVALAAAQSTAYATAVERENAEDEKAAKRALDKICGDAMDAAASGAAANLGSALHQFIDEINQGREPVIPADLRNDVDAYRNVMRDWDVVASEQFLVLDELKVAGTADVIGRHRKTGTLAVMDLKGLALDTPIPTPEGWTTMGAIEVGAQVFGSDGQVAAVTAKSETKQIGTYVVTFSDGEQIVCDREHLWWTFSGTNNGVESVTGIEEIAATMFDERGQRQHRVPTALPLDLPIADLPIDAYLLGAWLGDGHNRSGVISKGRDLFSILEADGHALGVEQINTRTDLCIARTVIGLTGKLRAANLLHNKHIPASYLRAAVDQRLRLLQGLMDTDGCWNRPRQRAVFSSTDKQLALEVEELACSLGLSPHFAEVPMFGFGKHVTSYVVDFHPQDLTVFRLPRKAELATDLRSSRRAKRRIIKTVTRGPDVETACIAVDSSNSTYLCGRRMIPTHNTGRHAVTFGQTSIAMQLALYSRGVIYHPDTGEREPILVDQDKAVVIHLPIGTGQCTLHETDIAQGWEAVQHALWVRTWRKHRNLVQALAFAKMDDDAPVTATPAPARQVRPVSWPTAIANSENVPTLERNYLDAVASGCDSAELIPLCVKRKAEIIGTPTTSVA